MISREVVGIESTLNLLDGKETKCVVGTDHHDAIAKVITIEKVPQNRQG